MACLFKGIQECFSRLRQRGPRAPVSAVYTPLSLVDTPLSPENTPLSPENTPLSPEDTPLSPVDTPSTSPSSDSTERDVKPEADLKAEFLDAWFPALQTESYLIPTEHFRTVHAYDKKQYGGGEYSTLKSVQDINNPSFNRDANQAAKKVLAAEDILERLHKSMKFIKEKSPKNVMVIMTQTKHRIYTNIYEGAEAMINNKTKDLACDLTDLLVIDKDRGVLIGAVVRNNGADLEALKCELKSAIAYVDQAREGVKPEGGWIATILLPNLARSVFEGTIEQMKMELRQVGGSAVTSRCLCQEDLNDGPKLMKWWKACWGENGSRMGDNVYRDMVYRFAVPLVTVELFLASKPRLQLWNTGEVVHALGKEFGRGWTRLALFPEQVKVLEEKPEDEERDDDVILLHGPPGTSKTILLMLRASFWLSVYKPVVAIVQTQEEGLAAACLVEHMLQEVVKKVGGEGVKMIDMSGVRVGDKGKVCRGQEELDAGLEELCRGAVGGAVHLLADEANAELVGLIYGKLQERRMIVRMWAAGVELTIPDNLKEKVRELRQPLRCPRAVTEEIQQSGYIKDGSVPDYSEPEVARAHRGLPPDVIEVDGKANSVKAGRAVGKHLKKLGVGVRPPGGQRALRYRDVFVLGAWSVTDFADVSRGLRAEGVPARHEPRDEEGRLTAAGRRDWVGGLATGGGEDAVTVTGYDTVTGLERPVVVWLDEGSTTDFQGRLHGMSRATAHLIIVRWKYDDSSSSSSSS